MVYLTTTRNCKQNNEQEGHISSFAHSYSYNNRTLAVLAALVNEGAADPLSQLGACIITHGI